MSRITGPRYNLHPSTEAHLGSSPASKWPKVAKAIYPVAHLSAQANAYHVTNRHGCLRQGHVSSNGIASPASSGIANPRTYRPRARRLRFKLCTELKTAHYCEVMEAAIVGSDTFGRVQSGIPTHRYGGPAHVMALSLSRNQGDLHTSRPYIAHIPNTYTGLDTRRG